MKNESLVQNMDDLVFEDRNKAYGAYYIRKTYSDNVNKALFICIFSGAMILVLPTLFSFTKITPPPVIADPHGLIILDPLKPTIILEPQTQVVPPVKTFNKKIIPVVTSVPVPDSPDIDFKSDDASNHVDAQPGTGTDIPVEGDGHIAVVTVKPMDITTPRDFVEQMPEYVGGPEEMIRFLQRKLKYPAAAERLGMEGTVFVRFVVDKDGKIINAEVIKGICESLDKEAKRVIASMPVWIAGIQNHTAVPVRMVLPIKFKSGSN